MVSRQPFYIISSFTLNSGRMTPVIHPAERKATYVRPTIYIWLNSFVRKALRELCDVFKLRNSWLNFSTLRSRLDYIVVGECSLYIKWLIIVFKRSSSHERFLIMCCIDASKNPLWNAIRTKKLPINLCQTTCDVPWEIRSIDGTSACKSSYLKTSLLLHGGSHSAFSSTVQG